MSYFDLQVNGYAGVDFNAESLTTGQIRSACEAMKEDGTEGMLATIITDGMESMKGKLRRLVQAREEDELVREVMVGLHIEGPFLNAADGFIGAHPRDHALAATVEGMAELLDAAGGLTRIVTLAPECDEGCKTTGFLADQGIVVSAGHCDPTLDQLRAAIDAGLTMFTHLGNGCPPELTRHDNIVERVLSLSEELWICFIGDGVHVPPFALRNYLHAAGMERCLMVTDAISAARAGPGKYSLAGWDLEIGDDLVARSPDGSHFVGSTATMPMVEGVLREMGLGEEEVRGLTWERPRRAVGIG
ncbi:MAG: N-acetylglucosamine-6-phosphate deacetylase [Roseibacillus sp.]